MSAVAGQRRIQYLAHFGSLREPGRDLEEQIVERYPKEAPSDDAAFLWGWIEMQSSRYAEAFEVFYSGNDVPRLYGEDGVARWRALRGG